MAIEICQMSEGHISVSEQFAEQQSAATLAHGPAWRSIFPAALGHRDRSLVALHDGKICGVFPLMHLHHWLFGAFTVSLPWLDYGGILANDDGTARALLGAAVAQAREDGAEFIELRSVEARFSDLPVRSDKVTFWLPLGNPDEIWKSLDSKVRNQIRKAVRSGLRCEFGREELLGEFYEVFGRNMRDLGTPVWGVGLFRKILAAFAKESEIAVVRQGNRVIAAGLSIALNGNVAMPSASALRDFRSFCPNNLLYWEVIKRACERGYRTFDFGRSTVGSGTYHFKKQWGPLRQSRP